jgi:hypothetical protein
MQASNTSHQLAKYAMESALGEYTLCHVCPSTLAGAATWLSRRLLDECTVWVSEHFLGC